LVVAILVYWLTVVYKPVVIIAHTSKFSEIIDMAVMGVLYFAFFTMGAQTGLWLSDDEDFNSTN
jgi:hypothetical protein